MATEPGVDAEVLDDGLWGGGASDEEPSEGAPSGQTAGDHLTSRRILAVLALVLALILVALVLYLLLLAGGGPTQQVDSDPVAGVKADAVITGPGRGKLPRFERPMGAAWSKDGERILVADAGNNRVVVFDRRGRFIREFGRFGVAKPLPGVPATWDPGELNYPTDVAVDDDDNVYVADFYNDSVSVFTEKGRFLRRFPDPGVGAGKGSSGAGGAGIAVTAVAVDGDLVYATDTYQVFVFTRDGKFVRQFGKPGAALGSLDHPNGVTVTDDGEVIVSDSNNSRLVSYSPRGQPLWKTGGRLSTGMEPESEIEFVLPRGVTSGDGTIVVSDALSHQLVVLDKSGAVTGRHGARGTEPAEFNFPNDVDWSDGRYVVADRENNRVQVVRLVPE